MNTNPLGASGPSATSPTHALYATGAGANSSATQPSLLPEPGDPSFPTLSLSTLALLLTQFDQADEANARKVQQSADAEAARDDDQHVQELRAKADDDCASAVDQGLGELVEGGLTIGSAFVPGTSTTADGGKSGRDWPTVLTGGAKAAHAFGQIASGGAKASSDQHDAAAARFDANSKADLRRYDEAHGDVQSAESAAQKVQQFLENAQAAANAARLAAATYRG